MSGVASIARVADTINIMKSGSGWSVPEGFIHAPGTDVLRAVYATGGAYLEDEVDHGAGEMKVKGAIALFGENDLLLLSDCKTTHLFLATGVSLEEQTLTVSYEGDLRDGDYLEGTPLLKFMDVTWFAARADANGEPGLYRQVSGMDPVLVASSVEAFEVELVEGSKSSGIRYEMSLATERQVADAAEAEGDRKVRREFSGYFNLRNFGA